MKKISKTIVFFGNERLATGVTTQAPILSRLIKDGYEIAAVVTNFTEAKTRNSRELEIKTLADKHGIPVLMPEKLADITKELQSYDAVVGVLAAYGKIVPESIINIFPHGIVNIHPSLLPQHRGPTPLESVILDGSAKTAVSLMQLVKAMDSGPVYAQEEYVLKDTETKQQLADELGKLGAEMLSKHLPDILAKKLKPKPQDEALATYDQLITKLDGAIDWNLRASDIERQVRAYAVWPGSRSELIGKEVVIIQAEVVNLTGVPGEVLNHEKQLVVCCGDQALKITSLKPAGKNVMTGQAFLAGYGKRLKH